jgi:hypothetical protein
VFSRVLKRLRADVRKRRYVVTLHADEEMFNDGLTGNDVENAILTGWIEERQRTGIPRQWKYRVCGFSLSGDRMEVIVKISSAGVLIVTVYLL